MPDPTPKRKAFAKRVEVVRDKLGFVSQEKFGAMLGVTRQTVGAWENATNDPSPASLKQFEALERGLLAEKPPEAVQQSPADYWRGVLYAAEAMSETVTRLLRESREASDKALRETIQKSATQLPEVGTAHLQPSEGE